MSMAAGRYIAMTLILMHNAIVPGAARAQGVFQVSPLFGAAQEYDSNLFFTPFDRQADFITRVSPGVESEYRSRVLTMLGRYTFDVERFADHPELTSADARQRAVMQVTYHPTTRLALTADGDLLKTQTPNELNALTNLALGRASAQRVSAHSSIKRQLDMVTAGTIDYVFTEDDVAGAPGIRSHAATIGAERHRSPRDTVTVNYRFHQYSFGTTSATSHALSLGWTRAVTRRARVSVDGGPRATDGSLAPDLSASIRYQFGQGELSVAYARTQTTVIGLTGIADAQSLAMTAAWKPRPSVQMRLSPAVYRSASAPLRADVYQLTANIERRIASELSLDIVLNMSLQQGALYTSLANATIPRQNVIVRLVAAPATRPR
jgi:hypothetical protein